MVRREATLARFKCLLPVRQLWRAEAEKRVSDDVVHVLLTKHSMGDMAFGSMSVGRPEVVGVGVFVSCCF